MASPRGFNEKITLVSPARRFRGLREKQKVLIRRYVSRQTKDLIFNCEIIL